MRVLGVDPGTATLGYGLVSDTGRGPQAVAYGVLTTSPLQPMPLRLRQLYQGLRALIREHEPAEVAVEELFFARNARSAITVAQARGIVLLAAAESDLPVAEYKPNQVKQSVSNYGHGDKNQMQTMVQILLGLPERPRPNDAADALAIALCHLQLRRYAQLGAR